MAKKKQHDISRLTDRDGVTERFAVDTVFAVGLFAVHKRDEHKASRAHVVTHLPSGAVAATCPDKASAVAAATTFHEVAGYAGMMCPFGTFPDGEDFALLVKAARRVAGAG